MKAKLKINDKEIEVEITEEELKKLEEKKPRKRWRAEKGQKYWLVNSNGALFSDKEDNWDIDNERYSRGNYFQTQEEAEFHRKELIYTQMLKDYIYEHDDVELDWNDAIKDKYYLMYNFYDKEIDSYSNWKYKPQGVICASNRQILKDAVKFIGEENVKKYILKVEE